MPRSNVLPADGRFRESLLSQAVLTPHDFLVATDHARRMRMPLVDAVVDLGLISEHDAYDALARATGMALVDLSTVTPSTLVLRLVPERVARRHGLLPLGEDNRQLSYAISRPFDVEAEQDIAFASGRKPRAFLARKSDLAMALDRFYPKLAEIDQLLERVRSEATVELFDCGDPSTPTESPVIDLCNHIIARAVEAGASDIHIEPTAQGLVARYRLCGILEPMITIPPEAAAAIRNRYKVMARADIAIRHRPQDGAFRLLVNGRGIEVRFSTLPTVLGEKLVMRVIDSQALPHDLASLGYDEESLAQLRYALNRPDGLVLMTGPTGSGKTTALYSALNYIRNGRTNIVSVEDPVERQIEGVNQIQVNGRAGNTFGAVLRSVLRQDPNVIMVGEVRDAEVAQIVGQAAYTGHLVLSSLHTADAVSAITRLVNLGLEPFKVAEALTAVVAQRLIRRVCPQCQHRHDDLDAKRLGREAGISAVPLSAGPGCDHCKHTGYVGRIPVAEVLAPNDPLRQAIIAGATASELRTALHAAGWRSMRDRALALVSAGITSLDEVNRVLSPEPAAAAAAARTGGKPRILVVEDDRITRMLVRLLLEREGYEVLEGENGRHAVELAHRDRPDLLIIDLHMPEMDGYEAIRNIRRDISLATLPVMVLTAESGPGVEHRVLEMGADDYAVKPFEPAVLLARVAAVFRRLGRASEAA